VTTLPLASAEVRVVVIYDDSATAKLVLPHAPALGGEIGLLERTKPAIRFSGLIGDVLANIMTLHDLELVDAAGASEEVEAADVEIIPETAPAGLLADPPIEAVSAAAILGPPADEPAPNHGEFQRLRKKILDLSEELDNIRMAPVQLPAPWIKLGAFTWVIPGKSHALKVEPGKKLNQIRLVVRINADDSSSEGVELDANNLERIITVLSQIETRLRAGEAAPAIIGGNATRKEHAP
jgi:hypothetical protein